MLAQDIGADHRPPACGHPIGNTGVGRGGVREGGHVPGIGERGPNG